MFPSPRARQPSNGSFPRKCSGTRNNGRGGIVIHDTQTGAKTAEWDAEPSNRIELSDDGKLLLQRAERGEEGRHINMLDADTGKVLWTEGKTTTTGRAVDSAVIFPYSKRVLTHRDGQDSMLVLDSATGKLLSEIKVSPSFSWITRYAIDKRADLAIAGNTMGEIVCVELETGATKYRFRTGYGYVKELSITPDGKRFVTVSEITDGRNPIQIWDLASGKLLESLFGSSGGVSFASVHPLSGQLVVENNSRLQARIWATTTTPESWVIPRNGSLCSPTFWNSDNRLFCASEVYPIALYDLSMKRTVWTPPVIQYDQVSVSADGSLAEVLPYPDRSKLQSAILLRISPNGSPTQAGEFLFDSDKRLEQLSADGHWIVAGRGSSFAIFDSMTQARQGSLGDPYLTAFRQHASIPGANRLLSLATANGSRGTANSTEEILLQELPGGKRLKTVTHPTVMNTLAVSKDGRIFAEAGIDRRIRIRDSETLEIKTEFRAHDAPIRSLAFHPGGRLLASASEDFTVKIWEISTGHMVEELRGFVATPFGLSFSPSGRRLACGTWGQGARLSETHVWELPTIAPEGAAPQ